MIKVYRTEISKGVFMTKLSKKVNVKEPLDANKLHMEKDDSFEKAYTIYIPLDATPDHVWEQCFERECKASFYTLKRKVTVEGDKLRAVTTPDEIKGRIEWIRKLVDAANQCVDEYNKEMKRREQADQAGKKKEQEDIKRMRKALKEK